VIAITPFLASGQLGEYEDKLLELYTADAALNQTIPDSIRSSTEWLLRLVNCFYSNRIEGNSTHPKDLLRTQEKGESSRSTEHNESIMELLAHLEAQIKAKGSLVTPSNVTSQGFIKELHKSFYEGLPESFLSIKNKDGKDIFDSDNNLICIQPGEYRALPVQVGKHIPPNSKEISGYMNWLEHQFNPTKIHGITQIMAAAALHHRFAWIHPFQDGNGRVIRLLTDCYMKCSGLSGYGLWSITRGFGRDTKEYYSALAQADKPKQGDTDGRGILSDSGLICFTKYFISTALDQVKYFSGLLEPRMLGTRIDYYFEMRAKGGLPDSSGTALPLLKITARDIYRLLLEKGAMSRGAIVQHLGKGEQTLRPVFKQMHSEGLISGKPRHDIKLKLDTTSIEFLFPKLW